MKNIKISQHSRFAPKGPKKPSGAVDDTGWDPWAPKPANQKPIVPKAPQPKKPVAPNIKDFSKGFGPETMEAIAMMDPTPDKAYTPWIIRRMKAKEIQERLSYG